MLWNMDFNTIFGWVVTSVFGFFAFCGLVAELDRHFGGFWKGILTILGVIILFALIMP